MRFMEENNHKNQHSTYKNYNTMFRYKGHDLKEKLFRYFKNTAEIFQNLHLQKKRERNRHELPHLLPKK